MKGNPTSWVKIVALTAVVAATASFASVVDPPSSTLTIARGDGTNAASVTVNDANNNVWVLQRSSDLQNWSEVAALKIYNGSSRRSFSEATASGLFFRGFFDPTRQGILNTVDNALHLPATSFNYAAPQLPLSFQVNPILAQDNTPLTNIT